MNKYLLLLAICLVTGIGNAQKLKTIEGNPNCISGDKNINIVFTYANLKVGKMEESAYVNREIVERDDKEEGTGDKWATKWKKDQTVRYPSKFIELFNAHAGELFDSKVIPDSQTSKYTIKVNTSFIEPGINVGVMRKPAKTNHVITIYESAKPDIILHKLEINGSPGSSGSIAGFDFDAGFRIQESFAKAAKEYAQFIYKKHIK